MIWLGLLFAILNINMLAYHQHSSPPDYEGRAEPLFHLYRTRAAQCLLSGDMAKCLPYTVEALRLNATAELNRRDDNRRGLWLMTGIVVRAAVNMGYHRDPSHSPDICSPLQAEYRRRAWLSVVSMDDMATFLGGFPRTHPTELYADTAEPRNLHEWEMVEGVDLPPSRPLTEHTASTYLIVKGRLGAALGRVTDLNTRTGGTSSYETVLKADRALYEAYEAFPPQMKVKTPAIDVRGGNEIGGETNAKPNLSYLMLSFMYHKGMLTLHRRFLTASISSKSTTTQNDQQFRLSRERCVTSALTVLEFQQYLEPRFYTRVQTREFLTLAAMTLYLELEVRRKMPAKDYPETSAIDTDIILRALRNTCERWAEAKGVVEEMGRNHRFLVEMLAGFEGEGIHLGAIAGSESQSLHTISPQAPIQRSYDGTQSADFCSAGFAMGRDDTIMDFDWVCSPIS